MNIFKMNYKKSNECGHSENKVIKHSISGAGFESHPSTCFSVLKREGCSYNNLFKQMSPLGAFL